jgi:hypothetical protein
MESSSSSSSNRHRVFIFKGFIPEASGSERFTAGIIPCRILASAGLLRSWEFRPTPHGRQTIAGVRPATGSEAAGAFNGAICELRDGSLDALRRSENTHMSEFISRPISDFEAVSWCPLPSGVEAVWVQASAPGFSIAPSPEYPLLQTQLDSWLLKALPYGEACARELLETTRGFPRFWVNDRELARRPWLHCPKYQQLDGLCRNHPPHPHNTFSFRCLEVEYAASVLARQLHLGEEGALGEEGFLGFSPSEPPPLNEQVCDWSGRKLDQAVVQDYVFGFGSLINTASRMSSDPDAVAAVPVRVAASVGYARAWNFQHPIAKITALGLEKTEAGAGRTINGVVCPVLSASGMEALDAREIGYTRVAIASEQLEPLSWQTLPDGARVWMYVPLGPLLSSEVGEADDDDAARAGVGLTGPSFQRPILQSYVDVCILGCLEYSEEFAKEFLTSTSQWEGPWINDRQIPRRPWVHQPRYKEIDMLLAAVIPEAFGHRRLPAEYSVEMMAAIARGGLQQLGGDEHDEHTSDEDHSISVVARHELSYK